MKRKSRWTKEDLEPQACVAAVIMGSNGEVLLQNHVKLKKWTIPIGKVRWHPKLDEDELIAALHKELREECGIHVVNQAKVSFTWFKAMRNGNPMNIPMHLYVITDYKGEILNLEPHKHSEQKFMNPRELVRTKKPISHALRLLLKLLDKANKPKRKRR